MCLTSLLKVSAKSSMSRICPATRNITPTGARRIIHWVILMTITVIEVKNFNTGSASSPTTAIATPKTMALTIIPRMFEPSAQRCSKGQVRVSLRFMSEPSGIWSKSNFYNLDFNFQSDFLPPGWVMKVWTFCKPAWIIFSGNKFLTKSMRVSSVVTYLSSASSVELLLTPTPGFIVVTRMIPIITAMRVVLMKNAMARPPIFPDNLMSRLPTATTRDGMTNGIMIPLSICRNKFPMNLMYIRWNFNLWFLVIWKESWA